MITDLELALTGVVLTALLAGCLMQFLVTMTRAKRARARAKLSIELQPQIREELANFLAGANNLSTIQDFVKRSRGDVADAMLSFQATVRGGARDRICQLSIDLSLIDEWCEDTRRKDIARRRTAFERLAFVCAYEPCRRIGGGLLETALNDTDAEVRFHAWRWLVKSGTINDIEKMFEAALSQSLLVRILLTEELRRHAMRLCERAVVWALQSNESSQVLAALEMLVTWERAVPIPDLSRLIEHNDRRIRIQALRLAPLVPLEKQDHAAIVRVLTGEDAELAVEAARTVGQIRLQAACADLARCLRSGDALLARTAAEALAQMPPIGWTTLEEMVSSTDAITAGAAGEALDRAQRKAKV